MIGRPALMSTSAHVQRAVEAAGGDLTTAVRLLAMSRTPEGRAAHRLLERAGRFADRDRGAIVTPA